MEYSSTSTTSGINRNGKFSLNIVALLITAVCTVLLGIGFAPVLQAAESAVAALPGVVDSVGPMDFYL